ncbi:MAG: DNA-binding protein [Deltaproteobacteria bacterium]|nr:DNA-binding protein [Deltaproteobacteria bacterium]
MKRAIGLVSVWVIMGLFLVTSATAQPGRGRSWGGWGPGGSYGRLYNPATVETLGGEVIKVDRYMPGRGMGYGVHLSLKTAAETIDVHLGPSWYVEQQGMAFAAGDKLQVTGSRITYQGKPAIIAAEVKKGDQVLKLRDAQGIPVWSGAGAGRRRR